MPWQSNFVDRLTTADEAVRRVGDGNLIRLPLGPVPVTLMNALARRRQSLQGVRVLQGATAMVPPWMEESDDWEFQLAYLTDFISPWVRPMMTAKRGDFAVTDYAIGAKVQEAERRDNWAADVFLALVSEPDEEGYVSFGYTLWHSRSLLRAAKCSIAEIGRDVIRTAGDNRVHLSEFDVVVEQRDPFPIRPRYPELSQERIEVTEVIGAYVSTIVNDRDTVQIGTGTLSSCMGSYLTEKVDLGIDAEILVASAVELVKAGVATGRHKTFHPGVATASHIVAGSDFAYCDGNPAIALYDIEWVNHLPRIASIENLVAINQAAAMDLTGQVAAESIGEEMYTGPGGQLVWTMGAMFAPGGRAIHVMPSTARAGAVSRIVPRLDPGTVVTVPRTYIDFVVTEHGIANLQGLTQRERAEALIEIAAPDFRDSLWAAARERFWPGAGGSVA